MGRGWFGKMAKIAEEEDRREGRRKGQRPEEDGREGRETRDEGRMANSR